MKNSRFLSHSAALSLAALVASAIGQPTPTPPNSSPNPSAGAVASPGPLPAAVVADPAWDDIKTLTYDQRADFSTGLTKLENKLDKQIADLNAKRAKMKNNTNEWDFAMKALVEARTYLKSTSAEVAETTPELWDNQKEKIQRAWQSTQDAYDRVKITTTQS